LEITHFLQNAELVRDRQIFMSTILIDEKLAPPTLDRLQFSLEKYPVETLFSLFPFRKSSQSLGDKLW
jgi:hypothetical protein